MQATVADIRATIAIKGCEAEDKRKLQALELWRASRNARDITRSSPSSVDCNILAELPQGTEIITFEEKTLSPNAFIFKIGTKDATGSGSYFLKISHNSAGLLSIKGEYDSMCAIHAATPWFCPRPIAWGNLASDPELYFYLCLFHDLSNINYETSLEHSDVQRQLVSRVADLHKSGKSSTGRFGFQCATYHGSTPVPHYWADSWEEYFVKTTKELINMDAEVNGHDEQLSELANILMQEVAPRLLRPLEGYGRSIDACLLHGDLWHGNTGLDNDSEQPMIFDGACFYGHHEYDIAVWRADWTKFTEEHVQEYFKLYPKSAPEADFDDRMALYAVRVNILDSILYPPEDGYRKNAIEGIRYLVQKYAANQSSILEN